MESRNSPKVETFSGIKLVSSFPTPIRHPFGMHRMERFAPMFDFRCFFGT